ncbi:site-specific DNA-methyltransferase [Gracilimonas tropica]|uniref:site-specific DNA-methyltransferase n=1 Tax=Gracilimonas tropica TaxID=454600 RepID=UPI000380CDE4|nr:site-specific DNA-methyltransferase [Gracilimonas tropica]
MPTLHWIGKEKVVNHHQDVPYRVLEHQYGFDAEKGEHQEPTESGNKIIHGDNLEALKSLLPEYEARIDCIYIDPPYNTGNEEWVYNDNVNHPKIKKWLGEVVGKEGDDLTRHDKWLCMMYPRLVLLNKLLKRSGSIVISIGHHEIQNLLLVCKEIFGSKQIVPVTVQTSGGKPSGGFNYQHEYIVFIVSKDFSSSRSKYSGGKVRSPFEGLTLATFDQTQRPNQTYPIFVNNKDGTLHSTGLSLQERIDKGEYSGDLKEFEFDFNEAPEGTVALWPITSKGDKCVWRLIADRLKDDWREGYIKIGENRYKKNPNKFSVQYLPSGVIEKLENNELEVIGTEDGSPTLVFGDNKTVGGQVPTIWSEKDFFTVKGTGKINEIFGKKAFNYPKPIQFINEILRAITDKNDVVLDSFAGSGTTAHAVQNLNAEDGGNRKFILVEMEDYADSITAERVKRVMKGYGKGKKKTEGTGGGFDYYQLGQPLFDENEQLNEEVEESRIREYVWYSETKTAFPKERAKDTHKHLLGTKDETDYYFFYEKEAITTLNHDFLATIKQKADQYVIYADNCLLSKEFLQSRNIIFKKIPRDISRF